jgi:DNA-binding MarR family transcriptional regulator
LRSQIKPDGHWGGGRRKIEVVFGADMEIENKMVEGLSESDRAELVRLLRKLTQAMRG